MIPATATGVETLASPGDSTSSSVSTVTGNAVVRVVGVCSGSGTLEIEKALTEGGAFFHYSTETLDDSDIDIWIKLQSGLYPYFRLTATNTESTDPIDCKYLVYFDSGYKFCTPIDIRDITDLSRTEVSDADLMSLIDVAVVQVNSDITCDVVEEVLLSGDARRPNTINGSNTEFWIDLTKFYYFGDLDDDGLVDEDDLIVYEYTSDNQKVLLTVSSLTTSGVDKGKFELSTAPAEDSYLTTTYRKQPVLDSNNLVKDACANLTAALAMSRIDPNDFSSLRIGGLKAVMGVGRKKSMTFLGKYEALVNKIDYLRTEAVQIVPTYESIDFEDIDRA